jgi:hypothetical protein
MRYWPALSIRFITTSIPATLVASFRLTEWRAGTERFMISRLKIILGPWLHRFLSPERELDAWMSPPHGLPLVSAATSGARSIDLPFTVDPSAREVLLVDCRDAPTNPVGWHVVPIWLKVSDSNEAEVMVGEHERLGWTTTPLRIPLLDDEPVPTGRLEVRVLEDQVSLGRLECFVKRDSG